MPVFSTIEGFWKGGPNGNKIRIEKERDGTTRGEYTGKNGGRAGFEGKLIDHGKKLKGYWFDIDAGVSEGNRYDCTIEMGLDEAADPTGNTLSAKFRTKDGGSGDWSAKRYSEMKAVPRDGGKISSFNFKDKKIFDRVTEDITGKKVAAAEKSREEYFSEATTFPWLDGAILYIPPPSVGSDYMSIVDIERHVRAMQVEQVARYKARLEADLPVIKALMDAGKGDVLKKRFNMDADIAKRFCELYDRLLKGEAMAEKLKERRPFKPSMGPWHAESEKPLEHIPDPYMADYELMRKLKKDEPKHWEEFTAKLQREIDWMTANMNDAEKLKTRSMDGDMAKRKVDIYTRMIKGEANLGKLKERPSFKPNNPSWHPESEKQAEHMPDQYFSAVELDRELARREKKHWEEYKAHLVAEVEMLTKIGEDAEKLKKLGLDGDGAKRRVEIFSKIIKGEERGVKLAERPAMKPNPPTINFRMSGSVMMHPRNVRAVLRGTK